MTAIQQVRGIDAIKVTEIPDGEGWRKVSIEWIDSSGAAHERPYYGHSAHLVGNDLRTHTARSEQARHDYLIGLIRGITLG